MTNSSYFGIQIAILASILCPQNQVPAFENTLWIGVLLPLFIALTGLSFGSQNQLKYFPYLMQKQSIKEGGD